MSGARRAEDARGQVRAALERRDYRAVYDLLRSLEAQRPLAPDDLSALADATWWLGHVNEYLELTERLHHAYLETGEVDRAAVHALALAGAWMMRGDFAQGSGWFSRGRRLLEGRPRGEGHALVLYGEIDQLLAEQRLDEAARAARELQRLGQELGHDTFAALGLLGEGVAEIRRGRLREGFGLLDEAMLPVLAGRVQDDWVGNIYCSIIATCYEVMDLDRAREWTRATERWLDGFADAVMYAGVCRAHRVQLHTVEGDWAEVEREAAEVERDLADFNVVAVAESTYQLGECYLVRGLHDRAEQCFHSAEARGREAQPGAALLRLARGDPEGAWAQVCTAVTAAGPDTFKCTRLLRAQVEIGLAAGHPAAAAAAAERLDELCRTYPTPGFAAWAAHARGQVLLAQGDAGAALEPLGVAASGYRRLRAPYDAARVDLLLAQAHRALDDADTAAAHERAAAEAFESLGVPVPTTAGPQGPGGLTAREAEVLRVVAGGASNREVAAALSISEATVRRHLANIYAKLEVGTRTAAAAWAHEHGLGPRR